MKIKYWLLLMNLMVLPAVAVAQDAHKRGWYLGGGIGAGRVEAKLSDLRVSPQDSGESIQGDSINTTAFTAKITAGYRIVDFFAIEASYLYFDDADEKLCFLDDMTGDCTESRPLPPGNVASVLGSAAWTVEVPINAGAFYAVGIWPVNDIFEVFGKVGGIYWEADAQGFETIVGEIVPPDPATIPVTNSPQNNKLDGTDLAGGLGVNLNTDVGITVKAEAEYFDLEDFDTVWLISISAFYNF